MSVSVILPTFKRPEGLRAALQSLLIQTELPDEIIVVDNDAAKSAECAVKTAQAVAKCDVVYVSEPRAGVANARNAGFAAAKGRYIAFLDDDEIASPIWLESLRITADTLGANVVFGALRGQAAGSGGLRGKLAERLYSRVGPDQHAMLAEPFGCGNSYIDRAAFDLPDAPFDPRHNEMGGEDDAFFAMLAEKGARFAWSPLAKAIECVDPVRTRWRYLLARSFAFGQGATQNCTHGKRTDWAGVMFWMAVGAGQLTVFGPLAGIAALLRLDQAASLIDRTVQGAGKLFWMNGFEPRFYGEAASVK